MTKHLTRLNPETLPDSASIGYSQITIVEPGRLAFISGQVAASRNGEPVPHSLVDQMKIVAANARAALDAVGASPRDIVIARAYVVDLTPERLGLLMQPLMDVFDGEKPSLTGVGVAALAGPDFQVELELTVRISD
jgi:enamine deaminase RidA (YjgF/YER057c/UK114 family)